jgi:hypothetical protein
MGTFMERAREMFGHTVKVGKAELMRSFDLPFNPELSEALVPEVAERMRETSECQPEQIQAPSNAVLEPMISFAHVSTWFGERKVLDSVSFYVTWGETLGSV